MVTTGVPGSSTINLRRELKLLCSVTGPSNTSTVTQHRVAAPQQNFTSPICVPEKFQRGNARPIKLRRPVPMRFADVAVDLAALLSASRSVASKHLALRAQQLDRYNKTSSVAAALRPTRHPDASDQKLRETQPPEATRDDRSVGPGASTIATSGPRDASSSLARRAASLDEGIAAHTLRSKENEHLEIPSFIVQPKDATSSHILRELRQKEYADSAASRNRESALKSDIPSKLHPLDPRLKEQVKLGEISRLVPAHPPEEAGQHALPEGVDANVFRGHRVANAPGMSTGADERIAKESQGEDLMRSPITSAHQPSPGIETVAGVSGSALDAPENVAGASATVEDEVPIATDVERDSTSSAYQLRESKVPSSRLSRLWNYGGLAAGMLGGALSESISRGLGGGGQGSVMLSAGNMERLVARLSRMRGAALKLGQMMSFQDTKMLPGPIQEVLQRVQDRADYMPSWQRDGVLTKNLGSDWRELFDKFEEKPIAAASIGQVHRATLKSSGAEVAVKIQFPGVADSINSDLDNLAVLLAATKLLPKGLYLNKTIDNARTELAWECDYLREAECGQRYRELLADERDTFLVPRIYPEASGKQVLTMEYMDGVGVTRVKSFTQDQRDWIGTQILRLCLREITEFRFMQTDPNWTNFLYNAGRNKLELLDFGASREYPERFISLYVQLLQAASKTDKDRVRVLSEELGYLTGHESRAMLEAHTQSVLTLAEPFLDSAPEVYDFRQQTITDRVKALIPVMIRERLAPPPEETYSLHRKLSGAFLLCAKLGSRVRCRDMFENSLQRTHMISGL